MSMLESPPPGLPVLTPQDKAKFNRIFQGCQPVSGLLSGEKVHDIFVMSRLSVEKLSQIWTLADTRDRCAFDSTDFTIAMYFIQAAMSGQLSSIPTSLPPGLYQQAGGGDVVHGTNSASAHLGSPGTSSFPAAVRQLPVQTNHTGQPSTAPALPSRRPGLAGQITETLPSPDVAPQETGQWDITPVGKARADRFFDILDSQKRGYIEGNVAVPFMLQSRLPKEALAQVWDLADVNNEGRLTRDEFAIAMYLIQAKISGEEIPMTLPSSLVPPSMRLDDPSVRFLQSFEVDGINDVEGDAGIYEAAHEYYLAALEMDADLWSSRPTTPQPFSFSSSQSSTSPRAPQSSTSASPSNIARPADTMRSGLCVVCQDEEADVAVVDCGHLAMCRTCSDLVWASSRKCPLCRTRIATEARLLRIFKT
ncbi:EF-hand [Gyrodon lividus]|nr:EF-hand [Gyrodon lividus]